MTDISGGRSLGCECYSCVHNFSFAWQNAMDDMDGMITLICDYLLASKHMALRQAPWLPEHGCMMHNNSTFQL